MAKASGTSTSTSHVGRILPTLLTASPGGERKEHLRKELVITAELLRYVAALRDIRKVRSSDGMARDLGISVVQAAKLRERVTKVNAKLPPGLRYPVIGRAEDLARKPELQWREVLDKPRPVKPAKVKKPQTSSASGNWGPGIRSDPEHLALVRAVKARWAAGQSLEQIAVELNLPRQKVYTWVATAYLDLKFSKEDLNYKPKSGV